MDQQTPGYEIPFHGALAEPITIAGAPRAAAVSIGTLTAVICLGLQAPLIGLPLGLALHAAVAWASRHDPYVLDVLRRHLRHRAHLDG
jgi:type IV secretion system protein VirB3